MTTKFLFSKAHCTNSHAEHPEHAKIEVTQELIDRIKEAQKVLVDSRYDEVSMQWHCDWDEGGGVRLDGGGLTVGQGGFWFGCYFKYQEGKAETSIMQLQVLERIMELPDAIHYGEDDEDFIVSCKEKEEEN